MSAQHTRLYFTKHHTRGLLAGLYTFHSVGFCTVADAARWVGMVEKRARKLGWELSDKSFQSYTRGAPVQ